MDKQDAELIKKILRESIRLETNSFEYYHHYSQQDGLTPLVQSLLRRLAEEERAHRFAFVQEYRAFLNSSAGKKSEKDAEHMNFTLPKTVEFCLNKTLPGVEVAAVSFPGRFFGGDNIMHYTINKGVYQGELVLLYDVMGHDFHTTAVNSFVSEITGRYVEGIVPAPRPLAGSVVSGLFNRINKEMNAGNEMEAVFLTALFFLINPASNTLSFANSGHDHPLIFCADGKLRSLSGSQLLIGIDSDIEFTARDIDFNPGESVFAYSDGLVETKNARGEMYGRDRVIDILRKVFSDNPKAHPSYFIEQSLRGLGRFLGTHKPQDEISIVALRRRDVK